MFLNREDAARQLARKLKHRKLHYPLVLGIPRGGVVTGAALARELGADLDVVLARKLRAPMQPELALGAIAENGQIYLNDYGQQVAELQEAYLQKESRRQLAEILRRSKLVRAIRPPAPIAWRSVIVTDDGIATGSTMIAALQVVRAQSPRELIVAVPVGAQDRLDEVRRWCDDVVCQLVPPVLWSIGEFYSDFRQVEDEEVVQVLKGFAPVSEFAEATH